MSHTLNRRGRLLDATNANRFDGIEGGLEKELASAITKVLLVLTNHADDKSMPVQQVLTLLTAYTEENVNQLDLTKFIGAERSAVSRLLARLGEGEILGKPGLRWAQTSIDPINRTRRIVSLTTRGRSVVDGALKAALFKPHRIYDQEEKCSIQ